MHSPNETVHKPAMRCRRLIHAPLLPSARKQKFASNASLSVAFANAGQVSRFGEETGQVGYSGDSCGARK